MRRQGLGINIFTTLSNSWKLFTSSLRFFLKNKDLILLPVFSLLLMGVTLLLALVCYKNFSFNNISQHTFLFYLLSVFLFFVTLNVINTFFNAALIACATHRMQNKKDKLTHGLKHASQRLPQLLILAVINTTVGAIVNILENLHSRIADFIGSVFGFAWSASTYLVLPAMVVDNIAAFPAIKRGIRFFGRNFIRVLSIYGLFAIIFTIIADIITFAIYAFSSLALAQLSPAETFDMIILTAVFIATFWATASSVNAIAQSALYLRMIKQETLKDFDNTVLNKVYVNLNKTN